MARRLLNVVTFAILPLLAQCAATADDGDAAVEPRHIREYAFVSVLSSDDFLLAARVLGFSIKFTNSTIPFIVFCTEDVSNDSVATLEAEGIETRRIEKFDTPYIRTHKARKFQYTKIRLWSLTEFKALVHLDLDTLLLDDVSELFQCGDFCASLRHSDMFNSGVFVFRPNMTVHAQMESSAHTLESYDGGDQGFLNSFFWQVKYAPMFAPNITWRERILRLSSAYNYDVGMYYLRNRELVTPKIIHYTLGPLKPWKWWSYPTFDLNWKWLEIIDLDFASPKFDKQTVQMPSEYEKRWISPVIILAGVGAGFVTVPEAVLPTPAWIIATLTGATVASFLATAYARFRLQRPFGLLSSVILVFTICGVVLLCWNILLLIQTPTMRFKWAIVFMAGGVLGVSYLLDSLLVFSRCCRVLQYLPLDRQK
ncbi:Protein T10B10.8 [Aphelenchoides avenae]|nr:Protein T10B10.8 [Aphelenchus avenae]